MNIPLNANVRCSDGAAGRSTVIVVDPRTETVTHVVVDSQGTEYLVPIEVISESGTDHIQLRWSLADLAKAERYDKVVYVGDGSAEGLGVPCDDLSNHHGCRLHDGNGGAFVSQRRASPGK